MELQSCERAQYDHWYHRIRPPLLNMRVTSGDAPSSYSVHTAPALQDLSPSSAASQP